MALSFLTIEVEIEDVRGELVDPTPFRACRGEFRLNILVIRTRCLRDSVRQLFEELYHLFIRGEFDPGSGRTLAACLTHASQGDPQG